MKYTIKYRESSPNKLDIDFIPINIKLSSIFSQVNVNTYPEFIYLVSNSISAGYEFVHFRFFNDMDWEDKAWAKRVKGGDLKENEIFLVHDVIGETVIKIKDFNRILFDYGTELLNIFRADRTLPENWVNEMAEALDLLNRS